MGIVSETEKASLLSPDGFHRRQLEAAQKAGAQTGSIYFGREESFKEISGFLAQWNPECAAVLAPVPKTDFLLDGVTRAGVKMLLNALSTCTMVRLGRVMGNYMIWVVPSNLKLIDRSTRYIQRLTGLDYQAGQPPALRGHGIHRAAHESRPGLSAGGGRGGDAGPPQTRQPGSRETAAGRAVSYPYTAGPGSATVRTPMTLDDLLLEAEDKMSKTEQVVVNEFAGVRTGKASPALVENIMVEVYGSQMRIRELAGITTPEPRTLTIQPWDVNSLHPIEKAILKSNLGLTPSIQGKAIRLFFPELSEERRQEFVKIVRKMAEDGRVAIRHVRRDAMEQVKKHGHDSGITEDEVKHAEKELQKLTDEYIAKIDTHLAHKEKEIMTV